MTGEQAIEELERALQRKGLKTTAQRRLITEVFFDPQFRQDHPTVDTLYRQVKSRDQSVGFATVYRTMRLFEEAGIVKRHEFGDGRARYEETPATHHDHLIDVRSGKVTEFHNEEIERIQQEIAKAYGSKLVGHRLELYVLPLDADKATEQ